MGLFRLRTLLRSWPLLLSGAIALWWTQPHFGWNYCPLQGFKHSSEFIDELYPFHSRYNAKAIEWEHRRADNGIPKEFTGPVTQERVDFVEKQAFAAMSACFAENGPRFCRYAGPDAKAFIRDDQERFAIAKDDEWQYRYVLPNSDVGMTIIPLESGFGSHMTIIDYAENWEFTRSICVPGCDCNTRFDG